MLSPIPLVRARYVKPFAALLDAGGARTERLLQSAGLDAETPSRPDAVIGQVQLWKFVALAAHAEGRDLGMRAAQAPLHALGSFGRSVLSAATLREALQRFCSGAAKEATARFFVADGDDLAWFCRDRIAGGEDEAVQIEQYLVVLMVNAVSAVLGPGWRPNQVRLQARAPSPLVEWEMLGGALVEHGCGHLAIAIPHALLPARTWRPAPKHLRPDAESRHEMMSGATSVLCGLDTPTSIRTLLKSAIRQGTPRIELLASAAGVSR